MVVSVVLVVLGDDAVQSAALILRDGGTNRRRKKIIRDEEQGESGGKSSPGWGGFFAGNGVQATGDRGERGAGGGCSELASCCHWHSHPGGFPVEWRGRSSCEVTGTGGGQGQMPTRERGEKREREMQMQSARRKKGPRGLLHMQSGDSCDSRKGRRTPAFCVIICFPVSYLQKEWANGQIK
ncbi:hypothetical protein K456DRAFT_97190 [Colletotrichum gloeosporioides 23]|nr:hypothetical protein K456DRAFT_97190 [Colletotrichum gloeosporioides 23]